MIITILEYGKIRFARFFYWKTFQRLVTYFISYHSHQYDEIINLDIPFAVFSFIFLVSFSIFLSLSLSLSLLSSYICCMSIDTLEMKCKRGREVVLVTLFYFTYLFLLLLLRRSPDTRIYIFKYIYIYMFDIVEDRLSTAVSSLFIKSESAKTVFHPSQSAYVHLYICLCVRV